MAFKTQHQAALQMAAVSVLVSACSTTYKSEKHPATSQVSNTRTTTIQASAANTNVAITKARSEFAHRLSSAAKERTRHRIVYDGRYIRIGYPWGDVPNNIGVCTDVVVRSYRKLGIDLQQQVHADMSRYFPVYPNLPKWNLNGPDSNIDHRRVYNLKTFFSRHGVTLPRSRDPRQYRPGDLVTWQLGPGQEHIGIVVNQRSKKDPNRHLIVHNIAQGPKMEDVLFSFPMTGHYRYYGQMRNMGPALVSRTPQSHLGVDFVPPELLR